MVAATGSRRRAAPAQPRRRKEPDTPWHRLAPDLRAGTKLAWHAGGVEEVYEEIPGHGRGLVGHIDHSQGLFQIGNLYGKLIYWPKHLVSWGAATWERVKAECILVEAIDHTNNRCFSLSVDECIEYGEPYSNKHGPRFGVHENTWRKEQGVNPKEFAAAMTAPAAPAPEPVVPPPAQGSLL